MESISDNMDADLKGWILRYESTIVSSAFRAWKRRWGVLSDFCLYLYRYPEDNECLTALLLPSAKVSQSHEDSGNTFTIRIEENSGKSVYLAAENASDFEHWYGALSAAALLQRPQRKGVDLSANGYIESQHSQTPHRSAVSLSEAIPREGHFDSFDYNGHVQHQNQPTYTNHNYVSENSVHGSLNVLNERVGNSAQLRAEHTNPGARFIPHDDGHVTSNRVTTTTTTSTSHMHPQQMHYDQRDQRMRQEFHQRSNMSDTRSLDSRARHIETVKEDPGMSDSMILATKPIEEIKRKYPVSGLAKRMSIAASDLLGKSHDELILLLIQLNREKSNLERLADYYRLIINQQIEEEQHSTDPQHTRIIQDKLNKSRKELADIENQVELSQPLITFIDNIVKMGSLYGGDDLMFASEYRSHLLQPGEFRALPDNVHFMRKLQEKNVSRELSAGELRDQRDGGVYEFPHDTFQAVPESMEFRKTREQLESELKELEKIYTNFHSKKEELSDYMSKVQRNGLRAPLSPGARPGATVQRGTYLETDLDTSRRVDLAAKYPRRLNSTSSGGVQMRRGAYTMPASRSLSTGGTSAKDVRDYRMVRSKTMPDDVFVTTVQQQQQQQQQQPVPKPRAAANGSYTVTRVQQQHHQQSQHHQEPPTQQVREPVREEIITSSMSRSQQSLPSMGQQQPHHSHQPIRQQSREEIVTTTRSQMQERQPDVHSSKSSLTIESRPRLPHHPPPDRTMSTSVLASTLPPSQPQQISSSSTVITRTHEHSNTQPRSSTHRHSSVQDQLNMLLGNEDTCAVDNSKDDPWEQPSPTSPNKPLLSFNPNRFKVKTTLTSSAASGNRDSALNSLGKELQKRRGGTVFRVDAEDGPRRVAGGPEEEIVITESSHVKSAPTVIHQDRVTVTGTVQHQKIYEGSDHGGYNSSSGYNSELTQQQEDSTRSARTVRGGTKIVYEVDESVRVRTPSPQLDDHRPMEIASHSRPRVAIEYDYDRDQY